MTRRANAPAPPLRVVLADESAIFRQGLGLLLQACGVEVVAGVGDVPALVDEVGRLGPDVALLDVQMPPSRTDEGIRAALALKECWPGLGVLVLSPYVEPHWVATLLESAPSGIGYLLKERVEDVLGLVDALRRVAAGGIALDPEVVRTLVAARHGTATLERLTEREQEVLHLVAQGRSNAGIAQAMFLSLKTVEAHVDGIFRALDLEEAGSENRRVRSALAFLQSG